jgi:ketosteroid isomerase-like protein
MRYLIPVSLAVAACAGESQRGDADPRAAITAAMDRYMVHARAVNADSVAAFFTSNGTLFEPGIPPIVTRDSIRKFMGSFPGVRVDSATAVADTIEVHGDMALFWGSYFEKLAFPGQPDSEQHGKFLIQWLLEPDGTWRIHRYYRIPLPNMAAPPPAGDGSVKPDA